MKKKKKIGIYAGSFNPFHVGHLNVLHQAQKVFDEVIIAVGKNTEKDNSNKEPFPVNHPSLNGSRMFEFGGLLIDFLKQVEQNYFVDGEVCGEENTDVFLIRGLRNGDDLQYEQNQLNFLKEMDSSIKPVFFICDRKFGHISSSSLRALKKVSEKEYLKYVLTKSKKPDKITHHWNGVEWEYHCENDRWT